MKHLELRKLIREEIKSLSTKVDMLELANFLKNKNLGNNLKIQNLKYDDWQINFKISVDELSLDFSIVDYSNERQQALIIDISSSNKKGHYSKTIVAPHKNITPEKVFSHLKELFNNMNEKIQRKF